MTSSDQIPDMDTLYLDCHLATMEGSEPYGAIRDAALGTREDRIAWVGPQSGLSEDAISRTPAVHRLDGAWITPGLIDCHTHLVYAGSRTREFEMRLNGATYEEIARAGGGILSTVKAVRGASEEELVQQSTPRLKALMAEGVTSLEIKSGYGLDTASEIRMLKVANRLGLDFPVTVCPTFLGAHAIPPEYSGRSEAYIDLVIGEMLPAVAENKLAEAVDVFCERIAFSLAQTERVFKAAVDMGFKTKLHGEQLSNQNGTALAVRYGALSVDHLEYLDSAGVAAMAESDTVAVLLPGAFYFLNETQKPPVEALRTAGIPMAVSTDCNPGSSPCTSPLLIMNMACVLFGLTPAEALAGMTVNAAKALGLEADRGMLRVGMKADLAIWNIAEPAELAHSMGGNPCRFVVKDGELVC